MPGGDSNTQCSLASLPEDLLAHVLRFATGAARRDGSPPSAVALSDWRYASVSSTFRRAFIHNLTALELNDAAALKLAKLDWLPLRHCTSLRHIVIGEDCLLNDARVKRLFDVLFECHIHIRHLSIAMTGKITDASVLHFVNKFGHHVTHLDLPISAKATSSPPPIPSSQTPHNHQNFFQPISFNQLPHHTGPIMLGSQQLLQQHLSHLLTHGVPLPTASTPPPQTPTHIPHPVPQVPQPVPQFPPPLPTTYPLPLDFLIAYEAQNGQTTSAFDQAFTPPHADPIPSVQNPPGVQHSPTMLQHFHVPFPANADIPANADTPAIYDLTGTTPVIQATDHVNGDAQPPFSPPPGQDEVPPCSSMTDSQLSNDSFATVISRTLSLRQLVIGRATHIKNAGILALAHCTMLESLVMCCNDSINDISMISVLRRLPKLTVLRLRDMNLIGDGTISAVCAGHGSRKPALEFLELTRVGRVTDPIVRKLVNSCENLMTVHIRECPRISCDAASHLSCSMRLTNVIFKPQSRYAMGNRTSVHLSCASDTLRSLQLMGCANLNLDGIMALGNLPGLRRLFLSGLSHVSQDVMRAIGVFPRLDDLTLEGEMHLTDLGVKLLTAQRGHRFLHLALLDSTKNLSDEALDCIMTWCISLRTFEVHGTFHEGAADRLSECIPNASVTIEGARGYRQHIDGSGGVWDPVHGEAYDFIFEER